MPGGEAYVILCTVPEGRLAALMAAAQPAGVAVTVIGVIRAGAAAPRFVGPDRREVVLKRGSFSHF